MGGAIARGLIANNIVAAADVVCCDHNRDKLSRLKEFNGGITTTLSSREAAEGADIIILSVKPWCVESSLAEVRDLIDTAKQDLVSIAAGVSFDTLKGYLQDADATLFRVIPNTAIEVGSSMTFVSAYNSTDSRTDRIVKMFDALGSALLIPEEKMTAGTALASCGIAYAMRYIRAAMEGGIELGFKADDARDIVLNTVKGAAELLLASGEHPEDAIDKVTTPGGITIKGLNEMEKEGFSHAVIAGLKASK